MLLFLLPPSCMVAPIGNIANKFITSPIFSHPTTSFTNVNSLLPTMSFVNNIEMDIPIGQVPAFDFKVRERNPISVVNLSRESSMASSGQSTPYYDRMDINIDCNSTVGEPTLELSYKTEQEKALWVSMAVDHQKTTRPMNGCNEAPPTHVPHEKSIINIQLSYDM